MDINLIEEMGLSKTEAQIYHALLTEGTCTAKDVSAVTGVSYGKVYEFLESMQTKGAICFIPSKPAKYCAVNPKEIISAIKTKTNERLTRLDSFVDSSLEPLFKQQKSASKESNFHIIQGRTPVNTRLEESIMASKHSIKILTTENGLKRLVVLKDALKARKEAGVCVNILAPLTDSNKEDAQILCQCQPKHVGDPCVIVFLFDMQTCFIIDPLPDDENYKSGKDVAMCSENANFIKLMHTFFSHLCQQTDSPLLVGNEPSLLGEDIMFKGDMP